MKNFITNGPHISNISDIRFPNKALWNNVYFHDIQRETELVLVVWLVSLEMKDLHK